MLTGGENDYRADVQEAAGGGEGALEPRGDRVEPQGRFLRQWRADREFVEDEGFAPPLSDSRVDPGRWSSVVCGSWAWQEATRIHNKER